MPDLLGISSGENVLNRKIADRIVPNMRLPPAINVAFLGTDPGTCMGESRPLGRGADWAG